MSRPMKQSGVEWIGEIPIDWETKKLKHISSFVRTKYSMDDENLNYIGLENIVGWSGAVTETDSAYELDQSLICEAGDILFGKLRPYLAKVHLSQTKQCCSSEFAVIRMADSMCRPFFWYQFMSHGFIFKVDSSTYGTKMPRANAEFIKNIRVAVPPLDEQKRIAAFLDDKCARIDSVITKTSASIAEYKKLKQAIITRAVTRGIRPNRTLKHSGIDWLGDIPDDWTTPKFSAICSVITDYVASGSFASLAENVKYLDEPDYAMLVRTADVSNKGYNPKPVYINQHAYKFLSNSNLFGGELMFPNIGASVGDVYIVPVLYKRMSLAPNAIMVKTNKVDRYYYYYFQSKPGRLSIEDIAQSTAQAKVNKTDFRQLRVLLPPIDEQREIAAYLDAKCAAIDSLVAKKNQLVAELERLKKSLIYEYVTGKKEVAQ